MILKLLMLVLIINKVTSDPCNFNYELCQKDIKILQGEDCYQKNEDRNLGNLGKSSIKIKKLESLCHMSEIPENTTPFINSYIYAFTRTGRSASQKKPTLGYLPPPAFKSEIADVSILIVN